MGYRACDGDDRDLSGGGVVNSIFSGIVASFSAHEPLGFQQPQV
jgi:hypothetical protein